MVSIKNAQKQTFYIVRSMDNSIIHSGELEIGQIAGIIHKIEPAKEVLENIVAEFEKLKKSF